MIKAIALLPVLLVLTIPLAYGYTGEVLFLDGIFGWFENLFKSTPKTNAVTNNENNKPQPELEVIKDKVMIPTTIELLSYGNVTDGTIEKKFTHGDTKIIYSVGVENGVEETPPPSVLKAMKDSYSEEEQRMISERTKSMMFKRFNYGTVRILDIPMSEELVQMSKLHINDKLKKEFIDANFTCENFGDLAKRFVLEPLYTDGWAGSTENYIYTKAVNECYDTKIQEKMDKVMEELEEVNKEN